MTEIYPWHGAQWAHFRRRIRTNTLPHALLLSGPAGVGRADFARNLARVLLCDQPAETACGSCQGCRLFVAGSHPDYLEVTAEEGRQLKIDQVRDLNYFMSLSRACGHHKIALIVDADQMNRHASNGLLKTLEEPPPFSLILLITTRCALLPATVVSRCQQIVFKHPPRQTALAWLETRVPGVDAEKLLLRARGAPLPALALSGDGSADRQALLKDLTGLASGREAPLAIAARWQQSPPDLLLSWMLSLLTDIVKLHVSRAFNRQNAPDIDPDLRVLSEHIDSGCVFRLYDQLLYLRRLQLASLNQALLVEDIVLAWAQVFNRITRGQRNGGQ